MLFNSYIFIFLFLPIAVCGWYLLHKTGKPLIPKLFLVGMSLWFYAYFNISYLPIIVGSILFNYLLYLLFGRVVPRVRRRVLLGVGLAANIGVLFYYKYLDFCVENINALFHADHPLRHLLLPLGISFFTFQQVSFVVDSYKGKVPRYSLPDYALFVSFFPQLIAGPIVLHDEMIPQFSDPVCGRWNSENFARGLTAFSFGLAKKVLVADAFGGIANFGFDHIPSLDFGGAFFAMLAYTLQIYFDFSGYCDMAVGLGLFFNIRIPQNFNSPYRALDMDDFWKRWHITLTRFLRTNVYFPLGGSRKGTARRYVNMMIVFLVSGVWHGANWTFILWGVLNGAAVCVCKALAPLLEKMHRRAVWKALLWALTFLCVNLLWVLFRADSVSLAWEMIRRLFSFRVGALPETYYKVLQTGEFSLLTWAAGKLSEGFGTAVYKGLFFAAFGFGIFASVRLRNTHERLERFRPTAPRCIVCVILFVWSVLSLSGVSTFLYFNF